ncbi:MAG TPA: VWA domain-containing protein [Vicinamibacterales bacterium]|jgi:VWFA-related protein
MRAGLVVALVSAALAAQQSPPPPVFRSGTELVRFDLRATDASGRPLTDLRADEIEIVEDGSPRPILLFQHFEEPADTYADAQLRAVSAEVSSNRGAPRGHLYLLVFDQAHITTGNELPARRAAERFVSERVRPSDRVAIVGLPGPGPLIGFTADRTRAVAELAKVRGGLERTVITAGGELTVHEAYEIAAGNDRLITDVISRQALQAGADVGGTSDAGLSGAAGRQRDRDDDPASVRRAVIENARTLVAQADAAGRDFMLRLGDVLDRYRNIEGRKTVVLFSEGFEATNLAREVEQVEAAAAGAYAVFYSFDMNRRVGADVSAAAPETLPSSEIQARLEPLGSLAAATDGQLIPDAVGHIDAALDRVAMQARDYYVVGFTPAESARGAPGTYRHVGVRIRRAGAHVSARSGYAVPHDGNDGSPTRRDGIDAALAAPFPQQGLRVDYSTYQLRGDSAGRSQVILALEADLPLRDGVKASADVVFVVRDLHGGRVVASGSDTMPLPATATTGAATGVGRYRVHFDVPPGTYLMRTVVREPGGLVGSADRRIEVRGFSGPDVTASDVFFDSPGNPVPVRASAYRRDGMSGFVETYARSADQLRDLRVTATLVPADGGQPAATVGGELGEPTPGGTGLIRRATLVSPLTDVPAGAYVAHVTVSAGGETVADLTRAIDVREGTAPATAAPSAPELQPRDVLDSDYVKPARAALRAASTPFAAQASKGFDFFERGDYADAAADLAGAFAVDQHNAPVAFVLGWAYEAGGDRRQAIGSWRAAVSIDPKFLPAHLALADAYLRLSENGLAAQAINAGLAALPDSPELQAKLAQLQKR